MKTKHKKTKQNKNQAKKKNTYKHFNICTQIINTKRNPEKLHVSGGRVSLRGRKPTCPNGLQCTISSVHIQPLPIAGIELDL
jgi:hypothetical protein